MKQPVRDLVHDERLLAATEFRMIVAWEFPRPLPNGRCQKPNGIIVTLPGTTFRVIYRKPYEGSGLVAFGVRGDEDAGVSQIAHGA